MIELVPLGTARVVLRSATLLADTPRGLRGVSEIVSFDLDGARVRAHMAGLAAADWFVISPDGTTSTIEVRVTLETDDGALVYTQYTGRMDLTRVPPTVYSTPLFDTGDERYTWLSRIQAVAKGTFDESLLNLSYEVFELR
jgi:hypothetical protein